MDIVKKEKNERWPMYKIKMKKMVNAQNEK
jgi:hypothetical protein